MRGRHAGAAPAARIAGLGNAGANGDTGRRDVRFATVAAVHGHRTAAAESGDGIIAVDRPHAE